MNTIITLFSSILTFASMHLGMMVFFSLLVFFIFIFVKYLASKLNTKTETINEESKKEEKKETKKPSSSGGKKSFGSKVMVFIAFFMWIMVTGSIVWYFLHYMTANHNPDVMTHKQGMLTWDKPIGVKGINPNQRHLPSIVTINRNDDKVMEFETSDGIFYRWDKTNDKDNGVWRDNRNNSGHWRLDSYDNNRKIYLGWVSDDKGVPIFLGLRIF